MPKIELAVETKNSIDLKKIQKLMTQANASVLVGFPSGQVHIEAVHKDTGKRDRDGNVKYTGGSKVSIKNGKTVETSELAKELHYGSSRVPSRPFLEEGIESEAEKIKNVIGGELKKETDGGKANWGKVGAVAVGAVQEFVRGDYYKNTVPNSPKTIERKGSDKPLIDSGNLISQIQFVVEKS
jgi:hypothetical protein